MNAARRKVIKEINEALEAQRSRLENLLEEEQAAFDNMPEGVQNSARGEQMQDAMSALETATDHVTNAIEQLEELDPATTKTA